jgi:hypothetical protein
VEDNKQALASLDRLAELPADMLLRGHGDPWHGSMSDALARVRAAGTSRLHARVRRAARSDFLICVRPRAGPIFVEPCSTDMARR